jgi:hypothetical protein
LNAKLSSKDQEINRLARRENSLLNEGKALLNNFNRKVIELETIKEQTIKEQTIKEQTKFVSKSK